MPFIANIAQLKSLAIVGTAKNVGKTESLNYILGALRERHPELQLALTSIGIDGELRDQVTQTDKPEITLHNGMRFVTAENFFARSSYQPRYLTLIASTPPRSGGLYMHEHEASARRS